MLVGSSTEQLDLRTLVGSRGERARPLDRESGSELQVGPEVSEARVRREHERQGLSGALSLSAIPMQEMVLPEADVGSKAAVCMDTRTLAK